MSSVKGKARYQPGDKIAGRYQVHKALMGGMGEVYLCLDLQEMQPYALKTFQQRYLTDTQQLRRAFDQEVATWIALEKHPNIVRCFWMQMLDSQPFMALEWVADEEGRSVDLRGWLRRGPLELKLALEIALDICNGLRHAQAKRPGLVHRDLKPENILVAQGGLAKITDFGLAQIVEEAGLEVDADFRSGSRQSMVGRQGIAGTPSYMAPEQWRGESLDVRTDIYALGCILYEMVAGTQPFLVDFTPSTPQEWQLWLRSTQAAHEAAPLPRLPARLPAALDELLHCCLAKTQAARFATVDELSGQLVSVYQQRFDQSPPVRPPAGTFTAGDYNNRGVTQADLQQYERALADYDRAIALDPNDATAYSNRGNTHHALQQYAQALADFDRALVLDFNYATAYYNRGNTHHALQQYAQALANYDQAIALDPDDVKAYYNRGVTHKALQQYERALADFDLAVALAPNHVKAYYNRGITHAALQQYAQALADYGRAIALDPNDAKAYYNRGITHAALQQYAQALADYDRAVALDPNLAQAYCNRGNTHAALHQYAQALSDYDRAIELAPNDAKAYFNRGNAHDDLQQYDRALADYDWAIALAPDDSSTYVNRGSTHQALHQNERALADFDRAIELDPNNAKTYFNRAIVHADLQQNQRALADLGRAIELNPNDAPAYHNRGGDPCRYAGIWAGVGGL
jgi:tetratricopeptide (TPR) repeat protein